MPNPPNTHCSHCGAAFEAAEGYPRVCSNEDCGAMTFANPVPVSVVLQPLEVDGQTGLLVIRRGIPPQVGKLALVGGFVDEDERWQAAGAREAQEETGLTIDAEALEPFWFTSTEPRPNRVLLFSVAPPMAAADLPDFEPTHETTERGVVFGPGGLDEVFAFNLHTEAAERFFGERGIEVGNGYRTI